MPCAASSLLEKLLIQSQRFSHGVTHVLRMTLGYTQLLAIVERKYIAKIVRRREQVQPVASDTSLMILSLTLEVESDWSREVGVLAETSRGHNPLGCEGLIRSTTLILNHQVPSDDVHLLSP